MTQLIFSSNFNYQFFTLLIVILFFLNNYQISANRLSNKPDYQQLASTYNDLSYEDMDDNESPFSMSQNNVYIPDYDEVAARHPWSQLFHRQSERSIYNTNSYIPQKSGFALRHSKIQYNPNLSQKRSIPIELQKALFAHGIVGRRR
ncbi:unnamed protein product [Adineta steineri]|uniref:Uncharacterized protein n=2 Tax=Adineta steineri TaxID=433720 RepID=A0A818Q5X7_9BILA|nr:unnamed protein product [Adineta steineri]